MATKYSINNDKRYAPTGYEGDGNTDYVIPSCGLEDLDLAGAKKEYLEKKILLKL